MSSTKPFVCAVVPCKAQSRRVPNKNLQHVGGIPLWLRKAQQLDRLECIDSVWVDTDSPTIASEARSRGFNVLTRPAPVNEYDGHRLFAWEVSQLPEAAVYVQALCTAPFLSDASIEEAVEAVRYSSASAIAMREVAQYEWEDIRSMVDGSLKHKAHPSYGMDAIPNSDELDSRTVECMCLYAVDGEYARAEGKRFASDPHKVLLSDAEALDIDTPDQLEHARSIALGENEREMRFLRGLKPILSSALLADCQTFGSGKTYGVLRKSDLSGSLFNTDGVKLFGRACTLELTDGDGMSIYDALDHYKWCMPGNILCIHGSPDYAYFGELNASLALRAGAQSVLIDGVTRDSAEVRALGLPVLSVGTMPADCRDTLRVKSIGHTAQMGSVEVRHGELIFADADGCIAIPSNMEDEVLQAAIERAEDEIAIRFGIAAGATVEDILRVNEGF